MNTLLYVDFGLITGSVVIQVTALLIGLMRLRAYDVKSIDNNSTIDYLADHNKCCRIDAKSRPISPLIIAPLPRMLVISAVVSVGCLLAQVVIQVRHVYTDNDDDIACTHVNDGDTWYDRTEYCIHVWWWYAHVTQMMILCTLPLIGYSVLAAPYISGSGGQCIGDGRAIRRQQQLWFWAPDKSIYRLIYYMVIISMLISLVTEWGRLILLLWFNYSQLVFNSSTNNSQISSTAIVTFGLQCCMLICLIFILCAFVGADWVFIHRVHKVFSLIPHEIHAKKQVYSAEDTISIDYELCTDVSYGEVILQGQWVRGSVFNTLLRRWGFPYLILASVRILQEGLGLLPALLLRNLVDQISEDTHTSESMENDIRHGSVLIAGIVACNILTTFLRTHYDLKLSKIGLYSRGLLSDAIYRHSVGLRFYQRHMKWHSINKKSNEGRDMEKQEEQYCCTKPENDVENENKTQKEYQKQQQQRSTSDAAVMNHLLVDCPRICDQISNINNIWCLPLQVVFTLYLLYLQIGWGFFAGFTLTIVLIPINALLAKKMTSLNVIMMHENDKRITVLHEVLNKIKVIKMCGWSSNVMTWIKEPRGRYMKCLSWIKYLDALCVFFWAATPILVSLASFAAYAGIFNGHLTPGRVVASLALFNTLILPLNAYPWVINGAIEAYVSLHRINKFLSHYNPESSSNSNNNKKGIDGNKSGRIEIGNVFVNVGCTEESDTIEIENNDNVESSPCHRGGSFTLRIEDFSVEKGMIAIITGASGSGKSTFLNSIVGELTLQCMEMGKRDSGSKDLAFMDTNDMTPKGMTNKDTLCPRTLKLFPDHLTVAYLPQEAFIMSGTVRDNILFHFPATLKDALIKRINLTENDISKSDSINSVEGKKVILNNTINVVEELLMIESAKYCKALDSACLGPDLKEWEGGDMRLVGDRGGNLSGGQRHRVALARALYSNADVFVIDDFFGALDAVVAQRVIEHAIRPMLVAGKYVIIASDNPNVKTLAQEFGGDIFHIDESGTLKRKPKTALHTKNESNVKDKSTNQVDEHQVACVSTSNVSINISIPEIPHSSSILKGKMEAFAMHCHHVLMTQVISDSENSRDGNGNDNGDDNGKLQKQLVECLQVSNNYVRESITTDVSNTATNKSCDDKEIDACNEVTERGSIHINTILSYFFAMKVQLFLLILLFVFAMQGARNYGDYFVSVWSVDHKDDEKTKTNDEQREDIYNFLTILGYISLANICVALARSFLFAFAGLHAAQVMHDDVLVKVLHAPFSFFSAIPIGRVINRLDRDVNNIDDPLPFMFNIVLAQLFMLIGSVIIIGLTSSFMVLVAALPISIILYFIQMPYRRVNREIKRIESAARSPMLDNLRILLDGGAVIRSMGHRCTDYFIRQAMRDFDTWQRVTYNLMILQFWFNLAMQLIGCAVVAIVGSVALGVHYGGDHHSTIQMGLALAYVTPLTSYISNLLGSVTEVEKLFISVERVQEYRSLLSEREEQYNNNVKSSYGELPVINELSFPVVGALTLRNIYVQYSSSAPFALVNINLRINGGEKVAIVGRTGSGKSTLMQTVLSLTSFIADTRLAEQSYTSNKYTQVISQQTPLLQDYDDSINFSENNINDESKDDNYVPKNMTYYHNPNRNHQDKLLLSSSSGYISPAVFIDDIPITSMEPDWMRSHITVLPQECVVWEGTLLTNLFPFDARLRKLEHMREKGHHSADQVSNKLLGTSAVLVPSAEGSCDPIYTAYRDALIRTVLAHLGMSRYSLHHKVDEGGRNFSVGERHLLSISRLILSCFDLTKPPPITTTTDNTSTDYYLYNADNYTEIDLGSAAKLRKSRLVIMDEPAAVIDRDTEELMWSLVFKVFADSTILAVTHKIDSVFNLFGRVVVLERGQIIGDGSPEEMKMKKIGPFAALHN